MIPTLKRIASLLIPPTDVTDGTMTFTLHAPTTTHTSLPWRTDPPMAYFARNLLK